MINKDPVISVVIPAFRRPKLLKGAIASVLRQSFSDLELIVVDDDAQASAQAVVSTFKDPRISYVAQGVSRGGSAARNAGLMRARGELIAFLDDDDEWSPDFLEVLSKVLRASSEKVGVVYCPVEFMNVDGARRKSVVLAQAHGDVFASILAGERSIVGTVALVRRKVFDVCGGFDEALPSAQDWDMWIRAAKHFHFEYVLQPLATVRDFGPRISSDPLRPIVARELILKKYAQEFKQHPSAQIILLKRLGKLNTLLGRWREAWRWFVQAAADRPVEWIKVVAWLVLQRPWAVKVGEDPDRKSVV